jgi:hypothetical protein
LDRRLEQASAKDVPARKAHGSNSTGRILLESWEVSDSTSRIRRHLRGE